MNKLHRSEYLKEVKKKFPSVTADINKQDGLLSFEIDVFIRYTQGLINTNQKAAVEKAFSILNRFYVNGNKALHELIRNAVCEDLVFENSNAFVREWAYGILPEPLKVEREKWLKFMGYKHV